ncbi:hypothetical protein CN918_32310 [Priestia megaterium]|nr:hypothetical protein CN918_32310 [Priestia megaterium]
MHSASPEDKKELISWVLTNCYLKRRESNWILDYLKVHNGLLRNVHFVEDAKRYTNSMVMVSKLIQSDESFVFYDKDGTIYRDAERAFEYIKRFRDETYYIELQFKDRYHQPLFLKALSNETTPENISISPVVENFILNAEFEFLRNHLLNQIDKAIEENNSSLFHELSKVYKDMLANKPRQSYSLIKREPFTNNQ